MARYNKIALSTLNNCPQTKEVVAPATTPVGSICLGTGAIAAAVNAEQGTALYIADAAWCSGGDTDTDNASGDTLIMQRPLADNIYAALLADSVNMTTSDFALKVGADGELVAATVGTDHVDFYGVEIYNNTTGSAQLVQVRKA